jgi:hypothetical protein
MICVDDNEPFFQLAATSFLHTNNTSNVKKSTKIRIFYDRGKRGERGKREDTEESTTNDLRTWIHKTLYKMSFSSYLYRVLCINISSSLPSPIRTIPSALELPQILSLCTEWLAGFTADQELEMEMEFIYIPSPCPEDISLFNYHVFMIAYREVAMQVWVCSGVLTLLVVPSSFLGTVQILAMGSSCSQKLSQLVASASYLPLVSQVQERSSSPAPFSLSIAQLMCCHSSHILMMQKDTIATCYLQCQAQYQTSVLKYAKHNNHFNFLRVLYGNMCLVNSVWIIRRQPPPMRPINIILCLLFLRVGFHELVWPAQHAF